MATLDTRQAEELLDSLPGWAIDQGALARTFVFSGFAEAVAYVVRLAFAAEAADHHPGIHIDYKRVTLTYITHSEGGLTSTDFASAGVAGTIAHAMGGE